MHFSRASVFPVLAIATTAAAKGVWTTPHDSYSSSVGVLGCKINTDRVAYWPGSIGCDNICVKLTYGDRSVHLLRIDQSGGAYDISYDAWNYLQTGKSAATSPIAGGTVAMDYEEVDASECKDLIYTEGSKLPLSAANSMNYVAACLAEPNSWVAKNHVLFNICDAVCSLGHDEECSLDLNVSNQPSCPHTLGLTDKLASAPVYNIQYMTGKTVVASTGEVVPAQAKGQADTKAPADTKQPAATTLPAAPSVPEPASNNSPPASSAAPSPTPTTTAPVGGIFKELVNTPAPAVASSPAAQAVSSQLSSSTTSTEITSTSQPAAAVGQSTFVPNTGATSSVASAPGSTTTTPAPTAATPAATTLSIVTASAGLNTTVTRPGAPGASSSSPPLNAGHRGSVVPALALVVASVICMIFSAL
ncbi:hypothetical protein B0H63DRAFT_456695 [Podospora didyma]|uniref:Uncharacterized protein n=1 Tax=Podospora didyma TaxID=330526 RepID=A0AAE0P432_9PEZI|nr:hypothetical protein B0H63DRAFT_456695 [Podospora didyma]